MLEEMLNLIQDEITIEIDKKHKFAIYNHFQNTDILKLDFSSDEVNLKDYQVDGFLFENGKINFRYI